MTVQQLLAWVSYAHDRHDCSFDDVADKHTICLKQALLECEPKIESHGYGTSEGERELAVVLIHTCNYNEVCEMENSAYNIANQPMGVPTQIHRPDDEPIYLSATEAIRLAEEARQTFVTAPTLHNTPNNERPVGEILYHQGVPVEMPPLPQSYLTHPGVFTRELDLSQAARDLAEDIDRHVLNDVMAAITPSPTQGATVANEQ